MLAHGHGPDPVPARRFAAVELGPRRVLVGRQPHCVVNVEFGLCKPMYNDKADKSNARPGEMYSQVGEVF